MKNIFALIAVLALAACSTYDRGGNVAEYMARVNANQPRVINGYCASACTLYLTSPQTCYTDDAEFVFHGVSSNGVYSRDASDVFAARFWPAMRQHLIANNALRSDEYHFTMTGAEVRAIDAIKRECK